MRAARGGRAAHALRARPAPSARDRARPAHAARERVPGDGRRARERARVARTPARARTRSACSATRSSSRARCGPSSSTTPAPSTASCSTTSARSASRTRSSRSPGRSPSASGGLMQTHAVLGEQMLGGVAVLQGEGLRGRALATTSAGTAAAIPTGSAGRTIPVGARIFAVADALDAMTSDRPYRSGARLVRGAAPRSSARRGSSSTRTSWRRSATPSRGCGRFADASRPPEVRLAPLAMTTSGAGPEGGCPRWCARVLSAEPWSTGMLFRKTELPRQHWDSPR